jgi:hypothetical protein
VYHAYDDSLKTGEHFFNCFGSLITRDARCENKIWVAMAKRALNRKKSLSNNKLDLSF